MNNLYDALEICLQEIENGADIDTVLFRYPELAEELRPILETSVKAKSIAVPEPSADVMRRNRAKILQHAAVMRESRAQPSTARWSVSVRRALVSLAVIALLFVSSTGLVRAASSTLPGDDLYPVKRTWEGVQVLFTFDVAARDALEVEHENERLEEVSELFTEGRSVEVDFAGYLTRQEGDRWLVSNIPVVISAQTDLRDPSIAVGDAVRVRGVTQSDWTVLAERVDLLDAGVALPDLDDDALENENDNSGSGNGNGNENENDDDNSGPGSGNENESTQGQSTEAPDAEFEQEEISLEGTVSSISGNIVIVDGRPMNISSAEVRGDPAAGRRVKVDGYFDATGVFIVTRIEFLQGGSGGGNSDSDDNDNDSNDDHGGDDNSNDFDDNDNDNSNDDDNGGGGDGDNGNDSSGSGGGDD